MFSGKYGFVRVLADAFAEFLQGKHFSVGGLLSQADGFIDGMIERNIFL